MRPFFRGVFARDTLPNIVEKISRRVCGEHRLFPPIRTTLGIHRSAEPVIRDIFRQFWTNTGKMGKGIQRFHRQTFQTIRLFQHSDTIYRL